MTENERMLYEALAAVRGADVSAEAIAMLKAEVVARCVAAVEGERLTDNIPQASAVAYNVALNHAKTAILATRQS